MLEDADDNECEIPVIMGKGKMTLTPPSMFVVLEFNSTMFNQEENKNRIWTKTIISLDHGESVAKWINYSFTLIDVARKTSFISEKSLPINRLQLLN